MPGNPKKSGKRQTNAKIKNNTKNNFNKRSVSLNSNPVRMQESRAQAYGTEMSSYFKVTESKRMQGKYKDSVCVEGQEYLGSVAVPVGEVAGSNILNAFIRPSEFGNTRLASFGSIYEKFLFEVLEFEFVPAVPSTTKGSVILAYDRDISDPTPPANLEGVREYLSMEDTKCGNIWMNHKQTCKLEAPDTGYYTNDNKENGDDRLAFQGQFYLSMMSPTALSSGTTLGDVIFRYKCHFFIPGMQSDIIGGENFTNVNTSTAQAVINSWANLPAANGGEPSAEYPITNVAALGQAAVKLGEGLYRIAQTYKLAASGTVTPGLPVVVPIEPPSASAPQVQTLNLATIVQASGGQSAYEDDLVDIPKGGAYVYGKAVSAGATLSEINVDIIKMGKYLSDLSTFLT